MSKGAADELNTPLGTGPARPRRQLPLLKIAIGVAAVLLVVVAGWVTLVDDPFGGDPVAVVKVEKTASAIVSGNSAPVVAAAKPAEPGKPAEPVIRQGPGKSKIIELPDPDATGTAPVQQDDGVIISDPSQPAPVVLAAVADEALVESTPQGAIPRIGADGRRPMDVYARPVDSYAVGTARVAIVVGGLGVSEAGTDSALAALPGPVTLAFAPYGSDLGSWTTKARAQGHELLLQLPLEPFDYPNNDPGPKTLLVQGPAAQNVERLHWLLGRLGPYVGVVNYMGGKFTSEPAAMEPVLAELGSRGLLFLDDGSSTRSRAKEASKGKVPFAAADMIIDAELDPKSIGDRLTQLEAIARERGHAIGVASAYPVTIDQINNWAKGAASRGVVLVPVSALADSNPS